MRPLHNLVRSVQDETCCRCRVKKRHLFFLHFFFFFFCQEIEVKVNVFRTALNLAMLVTGGLIYVVTKIAKRRSECAR